MFNVSLSGTKAKVTRRLTLPATGPLAALDLEDSYEIKLDLGGLDPKRPAAKDVLKAYPKVLQNELNATRKKYDDACIKIWTTAAKEAAKPGMTEPKIKALGKKAEDAIIARWNDFNTKRANYVATSTLESLCDGASKKFDETAKKPKVAFSSEGLKSNRVGILAAILGAITIGAVSGGVGWLIAGIAGVKALTSGYRNAWEIGKKQSSDVQDCFNEVADGLAEAEATLKRLEPALSRLKSAKQAKATSMVSAHGALKKMEADMAKLESRAKTEKAVAEGGYITTLRTQISAQKKRLETLQKAVAADDQLQQAVKTASTAATAAAKQAKARRTGWDKIMAGYLKASKDGDTMLSTVSTLAKQFK